MRPINNMPQDLHQFTESMRKMQAEMARTIGVEGEKDAQNNFRTESFAGQAWAKRKYDLRRSVGKKVLSDTTLLKKSVQYQINALNTKVIIGVDLGLVPYAQLHNEGGEIAITDSMRKFFWAKHMELKKRKGADADADFWRNMALTKQTTLTIPQRQYIGIHSGLVQTWQTKLNKIIEKYIKQALL